ncbi:para-aminobenzoate synthase [Patellaria atrata CBS 101060]|uniref:aminodeoxychorismate synthase n=1 Tax=Patellaria atrata CBS 101060 TaxID=1346257 RepID=A0A9P4S7A3_9PEZI|nr:para-aminobenzoate synthase [Patellaria atrata CBS 101060]
MKPHDGITSSTSSARHVFHDRCAKRNPRVLYLDAYDSFSNNIIALLTTSLQATVESVHIDDLRYLQNQGAFYSLLEKFDAVVAGPGPGNPAKKSDVGLVEQLWNLPDDQLLPILGICLGFQSLGLAYGAQVERLKEPRHGLVMNVTHNQRSIFNKLDRFTATQYHSLFVNIGHFLQSGRHRSLSDNLWNPTSKCPLLQPLAWDLEDTENGPVLMAIRHMEKPFWGVQYHPESICTDEEGAKVIKNWWCLADEWLQSRKGVVLRDYKTLKVHGLSVLSPTKSSILSEAVNLHSCHPTLKKVLWQSMDLGALNVPRMFELLQAGRKQAILLKSTTNPRVDASDPGTGSHSILGVTDPNGVAQICYFQKESTVKFLSANGQVTYSSKCDDIWSFLQGFTQRRRVTGGPENSPFWGGLMGFVTYEAGLETISVKSCAMEHPSRRITRRPDICFALVTRSVIVDHLRSTVFVQSIRKDDQAFISETINALCTDVKPQGSSIPDPVYSPPPISSTTSPVRDTYCNQVRQCQSSIRAGDSYELCLTDQSTVVLSAPTDSWSLYLHLQKVNPAPFSAYIRLGRLGSGVTILSSSPERFLRWTRDGDAQFRPIKGTVKKSKDMTLEKATEILNSSKEKAENLMIVDLIRHDLHGIVGAGNTWMKQLMSVEEYKTVYQLVSVIEGRLRNRIPAGEAEDKSGIELLAASLPPGSMTGAPKKRSCELLADIEGKPRGIYSGVIGYLDFGGGGDFAVVIRTAYKWDDETGPVHEGSEEVGERWHVGAGGAITAQSTPEGEWAEMWTKRESTMRMFETA